jgi:hypothetical protein
MAAIVASFVLLVLVVVVVSGGGRGEGSSGRTSHGRSD